VNIKERRMSSFHNPFDDDDGDGEYNNPFADSHVSHAPSSSSSSSSSSLSNPFGNEKSNTIDASVQSITKGTSDMKISKGITTTNTNNNTTSTNSNYNDNTSTTSNGVKVLPFNNRLDDVPVEIFRYKVVYPGGIYVRVSPAIDAERTGEIVEFGTIFQASKSLVLDGVNYAKLANGNGWVFGKVGDTEVLELVEVIRVPTKAIKNTFATTLSYNNNETNNNNLQNPFDAVETPTVVNHGNAYSHHITLSRALQEKEKLFQGHRNENRYWREVRTKCGDCTTFDEFLQLVDRLQTHPPSIPEPGPARSAWMAHAHSDEQIRSTISIIASITRQVAEIADMVGLESSLWVLVHMASRVSHCMNLAVEAANARFESVSHSRQSELLYVVLEVGSRTKAHSADLAKSVDILPDDIRNFLQRWVIIKSHDPEPIMYSPERSIHEDSQQEEVTRTPVAEKSKTSWISTWICAESGQPPAFLPDCRPVMSTPTRSPFRGDDDNDNITDSAKKKSRAGRFWNEVEKQMKRLSDPNIQSSMLI